MAAAPGRHAGPPGGQDRQSRAGSRSTRGRRCGLQPRSRHGTGGVRGVHRPHQIAQHAIAKLGPRHERSLWVSVQQGNTVPARQQFRGEVGSDRALADATLAACDRDYRHTFPLFQYFGKTLGANAIPPIPRRLARAECLARHGNRDPGRNASVAMRGRGNGGKAAVQIGHPIKLGGCETAAEDNDAAHRKLAPA